MFIAVMGSAGPQKEKKTHQTAKRDQSVQFLLSKPGLKRLIDRMKASAEGSLDKAPLGFVLFLRFGQIFHVTFQTFVNVPDLKSKCFFNKN
jgi:hypothetical protein